MEYFSDLKAKLIYVFRIPDEAHRDCVKIGEATFDDGAEKYVIWGLFSPKKRQCGKIIQLRIFYRNCHNSFAPSLRIVRIC